jgi:hypothetical protein
VELLSSRTRPQEAFLSHANAALTPRRRLRIACLIVDDGWPIRHAALYLARISKSQGMSRSQPNRQQSPYIEPYPWTDSGLPSGHYELSPSPSRRTKSCTINIAR